MEAPLPLPIRCQGRRKDGRSCRQLLATVEGGVPVFRDNGWEIPDLPSIKCRKCGTVRYFRGGVPEEFGGSSGYLVDGELRGARAA